MPCSIGFFTVNSHWVLHSQGPNAALGPHFFRISEVYDPVDAQLFHHLSVLTNGKLVNPIDITRSNAVVRINDL